MKTKLRLVITLTYSQTLPPAEIRQARERLKSAARHLAGEGLLTGDGPELETWQSRVVKVKPTKHHDVRPQRTRS